MGHGRNDVAVVVVVGGGEDMCPYGSDSFKVEGNGHFMGGCTC